MTVLLIAPHRALNQHAFAVAWLAKRSAMKYARHMF